MEQVQELSQKIIQMKNNFANHVKQLMSNISEPVFIRSSVNTPLTVPAVPTGINAGVFILPCRVFKTPLRALPSSAMILKSFIFK